MLKVRVWPDSSAGPALIAVAHGTTNCAPASSATVSSAPLVKLGASLTGVSVIVKFCVAEVSKPPFAVPPLSWRRSVRLAEPFAFGAVVKLSAPVGDTAGGTENMPGLSFAVMVKLTVCADSLAGPALMPVAHGSTVCAPMSLSTVTVGPAVKAGASFTGVTLMTKVCGAEVSAPPSAVPPLSCRVSVIVAVPFASAAGV